MGARHSDMFRTAEEEKLVKLVPGEYGCIASHFLIYQEALRQDLPMAVIFEDDVQFLQGPEVFAQRAALALQNLNEEVGPDGWDLFYFNFGDTTSSRRIAA